MTLRSKILGNKIKEVAIGFEVPVEADPVDRPKVIYNPPSTAIYFTNDNEEFARVTFEKLDSIRVCRGEFPPYEDNWEENAPYCWVSKVVNSSWLISRHAYESEHYKNAYEFGGDADEMLTDYHHYLFSFHDEYVEVLASGVWFEVSKEPFEDNELQEGHPFLPLAKENSTSFKAHGITCEVRRSTVPESTLIERANLCSQPLFEFAPELDGAASTGIYLHLRNKNGKLYSILSKNFGGKIAEFDGFATLDDVKSQIVKWLSEISDRRREMGK